MSRAERRATWSVFWLLLAVYTLTFTGLPDVPDAEVEFQTTSALARRGSFALGGTSEAQGIAERRFNVVAVGEGAEARVYSWYGVGQALAALPLYAVGRVLALSAPGVEAAHAATQRYGVARSEYFAHLAVGWRNPLLGAATAALVAFVALRLGVSRRSAWLAGMSYGLCTFAWPQARSTLNDVQATFCLFAAFAFGVHARGRPRALGASALAGLAAGWALLTRVALGLAVAALACAVVLALLRERRRADLAAFVIGLGLCLALFVATNLARFGSPLESGYGAVLASGTFFSYAPQLGLAGLLAAPGKGLVWMAPGLTLALLARRVDRVWLVTTVAVALAVALPVACTQTWHGAYTYGPRYVLPLLPFAWVGVAFALERAVSRAAQLAVAGLFALGTVVAVAAVVVDPMTHQDLAAQGARVAWPDLPGVDERERDDARFVALQWDWRFAAPWAHWRIAAHRLRTGDELFPLDELFCLPSRERITPGEERSRGWNHLAWVDLAGRLGGPPWPGPLLALAFALLGARAVRSAFRS